MILSVALCTITTALVGGQLLMTLRPDNSPCDSRNPKGHCADMAWVAQKVIWVGWAGPGRHEGAQEQAAEGQGCLGTSCEYPA